MKLIKIDPKEIAILAEDSGKFLFRPNAEESLEKLLDTQEMINEAVDSVLKGIKDAGEKINPDFKGVKGEKIDLIKRQYGSRYTYKKAKVGELGQFLKEVSYHTVDPEAVDKYLEALGELPEGVSEKVREYKITVKRKDEKD